jgi:hypothetical protein
MKITSCPCHPAPPQKPANNPAPEQPEHRHEDSWLHMGLDAAHVGLELMHHAPEGPLHEVGVGVAGLATMAALFHGAQELKSNKLHALASFALAGEMGMSAVGHLSGHEETFHQVAMPLGLLHHGIEVYAGTRAALHAHAEGDRTHMLASLAKVGMEASLAAAHFVPGAALPLRLGAAVGLATSVYLSRH